MNSLENTNTDKMSNTRSNTNRRNTRQSFVDFRNIKKENIIVKAPTEQSIKTTDDKGRQSTVTNKKMNIFYNNNGIQSPLVISTPGKCFSYGGIQENNFPGALKLQMGIKIYGKNTEGKDLELRKQWLETWKEIAETCRMKIKEYAHKLDEIPEEIVIPPKTKFSKIVWSKDKETKEILYENGPSLYLPLKNTWVSVKSDEMDPKTNKPKILKLMKLSGTFCDENEEPIPFEPFTPKDIDYDNPIREYMDRKLNFFGMIEIESIMKVSGKYCFIARIVEGYLEPIGEVTYLPDMSTLKNMGLLKEAKSDNPMNDEDEEDDFNNNGNDTDDDEEKVSNMLKEAKMSDEVTPMDDEPVKDEDEPVEKKKVRKPKKVEVEENVEEVTVQKPKRRTRTKQ